MSWLFIFVYLCWVQPPEIMMCEVPLGVDTDSMFVRWVLCSFILVHPGGSCGSCRVPGSQLNVVGCSPLHLSHSLLHQEAASWCLIAALLHGKKGVSEIRITEIPAKFKVVPRRLGDDVLF